MPMPVCHFDTYRLKSLARAGLREVLIDNKSDQKSLKWLIKMLHLLIKRHNDFTLYIYYK